MTQEKIRIAPSGTTIGFTNFAAQRLAYTNDQAIVLTLLSAGHTPGMYILTANAVTTTTAAATASGLWQWPAPLGSDVTGSSTSFNFSTETTTVNPRTITSDGRSDITLTITPDSGLGLPTTNIYASAKWLAFTEQSP